MMMNRKKQKDIFVIGFAIFAMFFGAGNLIFPPYLGLITGKNWFFSFLCFMIMDIGLSMLALLVTAKIGRGSSGITECLGKLPSALILTLNVICLGPLIAIPRTAATAYEFSIAPFFPALDSRYFSVFFFAVVVLFCLRQSKVIDLIGTVFAPLILLALTVLIIKGIISPLGQIELASSIQAAAETGINAGYQTMDVMAAMVFSASILLTLRQKNYTGGNAQFHILARSGVIAAVILFFVYGGLAYLGASVSGMYPPETDRVVLLIAITRALLGKKGLILLGILVCAACLTPAIGLLSSAASFFEEQTSGKISYCIFVLVFAGTSCLISNLGISRILELASPILNILYPVLILMVFLGLFQRFIPHTAVYHASALGTLIISILTTVSEYMELPIDLASLPFYTFGFQWVVPALLCGFLGMMIVKREQILTPFRTGTIVVRT